MLRPKMIERVIEKVLIESDIPKFEHHHAKLIIRKTVDSVFAIIVEALQQGSRCLLLGLASFIRSSLLTSWCVVE
jgi:nucleoid DNA-binding protein